MKTLPPGLQTHLDSGATTLAWCWRLIRADATVYGFTDHDRDIAFDGTTFGAASGFTSSDIRQSVGLSIDNLDVSGALQSDRLNESDLAGGLFDAARIEIWRVNWAEPSQRLLMMSGSIGEVKRGETAFTAELRGLAHALDQQQGRTYQYACDATLGDARCGIDLDDPAFTGSGAVAAAATRYLFTATGLDAFAENWFAGGLLSWTEGANAGRQMEVKRFSLSNPSAEIELWRSMPSPIAPGDAFTITAGCDKTFPTCQAKFANAVNFRGFPHIPGNRFVLAYPVSGDPGNDGASMNA
ncbi:MULTISPECIES: DUF2163 domain-containing protein [Rhodomicrobium]|uniref:DUF2163 domain-containing protein n=1 Tax=Rhodomicrobium TaxID=1068 RepID=UPI000B4ACD91|nr:MULTISPECIES: DUF2163 domain-containing protein [Rhodomicrobium]